MNRLGLASAHQVHQGREARRVREDAQGGEALPRLSQSFPDTHLAGHGSLTAKWLACIYSRCL